MGKSIEKWQYGDFQTPIDLARKVVAVLKRNHGLSPDFVIEPTCGKGAFILASYEEFKNSTVLGFEIKAKYVVAINKANVLLPTGKKYYPGCTDISL